MFVYNIRYIIFRAIKYSMGRFLTALLLEKYNNTDRITCRKMSFVHLNSSHENTQNE